MPDPSDAVLIRLSKSISLPRQQFAAIYDLLAKAHNAQILKVLEILREPNIPIYLAAFKQARDGGWLRELIEQLHTENAFPEAVNETIAGQEVRQNLQGVIQPLNGLPKAELLYPGVQTAMRRVCRIVITVEGQEIKGTGFLVGPQAVLTAWHVVEPLFSAEGVLRDNSKQCIQIDFDRYGTQAGRSVSVIDESWLIGSSKYHKIESPKFKSIDQSLDPPTDFDQFLDYAVIRLAVPIGRQRGFYHLDKDRKPLVNQIGANITLVQHPEGIDIRVAMGAAMALWPPGLETRMFHNANTLGGSSGGPVFDANFNLVALHQCGFADQDGKPLYNGAIPTAFIAANDIPLDTVIGVDPIWRITGTNEVVIGREDFQNAVLQCATGDKRILVVSGDPKSGKTFSASVLRTFLGTAEHRIVVFSAADLSAEPRTLAAHLLTKIVGSNHDELPLTANSETANEAWIRDVLFPQFMMQINAAVVAQKLWIVIDDIDNNPIPNTASRHFLERLYVEAGTSSFLRIVLIGLTGPVPAVTPNYVVRDFTGLTELQDVQSYIERRLTELGQPFSQVEVTRLTSMVRNTANVFGLPRIDALVRAVSEVLEPTFLQQGSA